MPPDTIRYERAKLYAEVWDEPMLAVAARYGVSSVALAKTCRKLAVPTPPRGYWALRAAGREPAKPRLPPLKAGQRTAITTERSQDPNMPLARRQPPRLETDAYPRIVVPLVLEAPHTLITTSLPKLRSAAESARWSAAPDTERLDIRVTSPLLERAVILMDALIKALEARGHRVEITSPQPSPGVDQSGRPHASRPSLTRLKVDSELVTFHILEMIDYGRPSGRLCLSIEPVPAGWNLRTSWRDRKKPLERCLGDVVRGIMTLAHVLGQERTEQEGKRSEAQEAERKRAADWERYHLQQRKLVDLESPLCQAG